MTGLGVDYSSGRPSGAALAAQGVTTAIRYIRQGSSAKLLTLAEYRDLTAHGVTVLGVSELSTHDMETGRAAGQQACIADRTWLANLGIPLRQWACAADEHLAAGGPVSTAVAHAQGYVDVIGADAGVYGPIELVSACAADPVAGLAWRWLWGHEPTAAQITSLALWAWQRNTGTMTIDGVVCDLNTIYHSLGSVMALEQSDIQAVAAATANAIFAAQFTKQGTGQTGTISLPGFLQWSDTNFGVLAGLIRDGISAEQAALLLAIENHAAPTIDPAALKSSGLADDIVAAMVALFGKVTAPVPPVAS